MLLHQAFQTSSEQFLLLLYRPWSGGECVPLLLFGGTEAGRLFIGRLVPAGGHTWQNKRLDDVTHLSLRVSFFEIN